MGIEAGTYISDFNVNNPVNPSDTGSTLGNHARLIKTFIKNTFTGITGAVTATHTELNYSVGVTSAIQTQLNSVKTMEVATAPTLLNSWANQGGAYQVCQYWKDGMGMVHIHGVIKSGSTGTVAFNLGAGYRPAAQQTFATYSAGLNWVTADISAAGDVTVSFAGTSIMPLCGISFRAA